MNGDFKSLAYRLKEDNCSVLAYCPTQLKLYHEIGNILKLYEITELTDEIISIIRANQKCKLLIADNMGKEIEKKGLLEFDDYICEQYMLKPIVFIYGNCHAFAVRYILKQYRPFLEKYVLYFGKKIQEISKSDYFEKPIFRYCDVFIHQNIQVKNQYGEEWASENIIKRLNDKCRVIAIPNVYHLPKCFFPQISDKKPFILSNGDILFLRDEILDEAYRKKWSVEKAKSVYEDEDYYSGEKIEALWDVFRRKIEMREKEWDIKILSYIRTNLNSIYFFYEINHPTPNFINYLVKELLKILQVEVIETELEKLNDWRLDAYEMPMCASVKRYFEMDFIQDEMRKTGRKVYEKKWGVEDYIKQYWSMEWQDESLSRCLRLKSKLMWIRMKICNKMTKEIRKYTFG